MVVFPTEEVVFVVPEEVVFELPLSVVLSLPLSVALALPLSVVLALPLSVVLTPESVFPPLVVELSLESVLSLEVLVEPLELADWVSFKSEPASEPDEVELESEPDEVELDDPESLDSEDPDESDSLGSLLLLVEDEVSVVLVSEDDGEPVELVLLSVLDAPDDVEVSVELSLAEPDSLASEEDPLDESSDDPEVVLVLPEDSVLLEVSAMFMISLSFKFTVGVISLLSMVDVSKILRTKIIAVFILKCI